MREKIAFLLTIACAFLTMFQGLIPTPMFPVQDPATVTIISAITIYAVATLTAWKQALSKEINNKALLLTFGAAIAVTLGGLNDLFPLIHFSEVFSQWLRFGITFIIMGINILSKVLYPTDKTQSIL